MLDKVNSLLSVYDDPTALCPLVSVAAHRPMTQMAWSRLAAFIYYALMSPASITVIRRP